MDGASSSATPPLTAVVAASTFLDEASGTAPASRTAVEGSGFLDEASGTAPTLTGAVAGSSFLDGASLATAASVVAAGTAGAVGCTILRTIIAGGIQGLASLRGM